MIWGGPEEIEKKKFRRPFSRKKKFRRASSSGISRQETLLIIYQIQIQIQEKIKLGEAIARKK